LRDFPSAYPFDRKFPLALAASAIRKFRSTFIHPLLLSGVTADYDLRMRQGFVRATKIGHATRLMPFQTGSFLNAL
jgi:hypothetical protein